MQLNGWERTTALPPTPDFLRGRPTLVHFWSISCYICKDNLPTLESWKQTYGSGENGLQFVAVHMPRSEEDLDVARVRELVAEYGIDEPCAIDNEHEIGDRFETGGLWPYYVLFDADGKMKTRAAGNAGLTNVETALKRIGDC